MPGSSPSKVWSRTTPDLQQAVDLLAGALGAGVDLRASDRTPEGEAPELLVEATPVSGPRTTAPGSARRRLRLVLWNALADTGAADAGAADDADGTVWVVRRGTPALRQALRDRGASFVDLAGAVHVRLPWLIVDRTDLPRRPLANVSPPPVDPFGDHNSRVVRVLLESHLSHLDAAGAGPRVWGVRELAAAAGVDRTTTSKILRRLAAWQLVRLDRRGRSVEARVTEAVRLIDRWSASYDWTANASLAVHAPVGDPDRFLGRLPALLENAAGDRRWALTLQAGASVLAPHASWERLHLYVDVAHARELADLASTARWRPGEDGNVVLMQPFYRATVWEGVQRVRSLPVVSTVQLIVDLWQYPLRGREQAEHLLELWPGLRGASTRRTPVRRR